MIAIKRSISFALDSTKKKKGDAGSKKPDTARIRCVITWNKIRVRLSASHQANPDAWEKSLQRCKAKTTHGTNRTPAALINREIDDMEELVDGIFRLFESKDKVPTKEEFISEYERLTKPKDKNEDDDGKDTSIFPIFDQFLNECVRSGRWGIATIKKNKTVRNHLYAMSPNLTFEQLEQGGINRLIEYFNGIPDKTNRKGLSNKTIKKDIAFVKTFLRWAEENGYCGHNKLVSQNVRLKTAERPVIFLEWDELMKIYEFDFGSKHYLAQVRDVFCFCCFTSLRYSDVRNLRRSNISDNCITITTVKTSDRLTIELNKYSRAILKKYEDAPIPKGKALPVISCQKMNEYLKELGKMCGLDSTIIITTYKGNQRIDDEYKKWELLSTHAARRTFVSNAIMMGIPADIVMKWTGHSDYEAMRPYLEIANKAKRNAMTAFDRMGQNPGQKSDNE